ncbi:MAG TPA: extracellular solute-binding protein [Chloroflexota bacterium]|nr:extracellular solute-binding protein [Chloroflexota bacterium]
MRARLVIGLALAVVWAACRPGAAPSPAPGNAAGPAAPVGVAGGQGAPTWDAIVAAAKREGRISIMGPQGNETRDALTLGFQQQYPDIQVDYQGLAGSPLTAKVLAEVNAGQYLTDLTIAGTAGVVDTLIPANALAPVPPYLVGPNDSDPSVWRGGKYDYADSSGQYGLIFSVYVKPPFLYNPNQVSPDDFTSYRDLLAPRWKGKIVLRDPRIAGGGQAAITFLYATDSLGRDYLRQLFAQDPVISNDDRQIIDWVARGQYPIALGVSDTLANEAIERGLPVRNMDTARMREGGYVTSGNAVVSVVRNAPHQNAVTVYLDYLLSRDGQLAWSKAAGYASQRRDVPTDHVNPLFIPKDGITYQQNYSEQFVRMRDEILDFLKTVMPS